MIQRDETHRHRRKVPALTGIRGIAALWVVAFHLAYVAGQRFPGVLPAPLPVVRSGYLGVDLFFLLSGCVLMMTYGDEFRASLPKACVRFAIGRVFRILPLNLAVLTLFVLVSPVIDGDWVSSEPHDVATWLMAAGLVQGWVGHARVWNPPAWSLSAEWLAYWVFPLSAVAVMRLRRSATLLTFIGLPLVLIAAVFAARVPFTLDHTDRLGLLRCLGEFGAGTVLGRWLQLFPGSGRRSDAFFAIGLALSLLAMIGGRAGLLAMPAFTLLIAACADPLARWPRLLFGNRVSLWLGEISFSIYLLHWLVLQVAVRLADIGALTGTAAIGLLIVAAWATLPFAWITWSWIELPAQIAGHAAMARVARRQYLRPSGVGQKRSDPSEA